MKQRPVSKTQQKHHTVNSTHKAFNQLLSKFILSMFHMFKEKSLKYEEG